MTVFKKPRHGETLRNENIVVGHYPPNLAIVRTEENELFFLYGDSDQVELGTVVENEYLIPVSTLLPPERNRIIKLFGRMVR